MFASHRKRLPWAPHVGFARAPPGDAAPAACAGAASSGPKWLKGTESNSPGNYSSPIGPEFQASTTPSTETSKIFRSLQRHLRGQLCIFHHLPKEPLTRRLLLTSPRTGVLHPTGWNTPTGGEGGRSGSTTCSFHWDGNYHMHTWSSYFIYINELSN